MCRAEGGGGAVGGGGGGGGAGGDWVSKVGRHFKETMKLKHLKIKVYFESMGKIGLGIRIFAELWDKANYEMRNVKYAAIMYTRGKYMSSVERVGDLAIHKQLRVPP